MQFNKLLRLTIFILLLVVITVFTGWGGTAPDGSDFMVFG